MNDVVGGSHGLLGPIDRDFSIKMTVKIRVAEKQLIFAARHPKSFRLERFFLSCVYIVTAKRKGYAVKNHSEITLYLRCATLRLVLAEFTCEYYQYPTHLRNCNSLIGFS